MGIPEVILQEQIAMYMAALPCPPLPLIVSQESAEDLPKETYKNSHDLIATLLAFVMMHADPNLNQKRMEKQMELTDTLLKKLRESHHDLNKSYTAFSEFTAGYICAFANIDVCVKFMPLSHVTKDDPVHKACCSWHRAQEVLVFKSMTGYKKSSGAEGDPAIVEKILNTDFSNLPYQNLLSLHCKRFTEEDPIAGPLELMVV